MKILVISPHPDDEAIGCGGTIRKHAHAGDHVTALFLTSGEMGGHGGEKEQTRHIRENEAGEAALILGIAKIEFWQERDGALKASRKLTTRLVEFINCQGPDRIYVPNDREFHPDHRAAARLVKGALPRLRRQPAVLMFEVWTPLASMNEIVDITPYMEEKLAAIRAYSSQCDALRFDEAALGLARYRGELYCWPKTEPLAGRYAEAFIRHSA